MIRLKSTVKPPNLVIACAAANVAEEMGLALTITSGNDSKHMPSSRHYVNAALDFRTKDLSPAVLKEFRTKLAARLGDKYQVLLESTHLHVERDDLG